MKIAALIQARMSSKRLPGKVLKPICEKPMLELLIERVLRAKSIDDVIIVTSTDASDHPIISLCEKLNIKYFRGSLDDVLDRYYKAAIEYKIENMVRITADCPLIEPSIIDEVNRFYFSKSYDYASNIINPTFPDGLNTEVFSFNTLEKTWSNATLSPQREHVTYYIYTHPEIFKIGSYIGDRDLGYMRWCVDYSEDFELISKIYTNLYPIKKDFSWLDVLKFLENNPQLMKLNSHHRRNEALIKQLNLIK